MKLLIDMNLSPRWCPALEEAGIPARHWSELGPSTAADAQIMAYAAAEGFIVLTHDLDFGAILAATKGRGPSVVQLRTGDTSPETNAATVVAALRQCETELAEGALLTLDVSRSRVTLLPLRG
jgi:predicted nuclease of predicted toxin-antitoxin system